MTSLPVFMQAVKKGLVAGSHRRRPIQNHYVETFEVRAVVSKRFPDRSLEAVAADREAAMFLGNGQTEPCFLPTIVLVENRKHLVATAFCFFEDATIRGSIKKPALPSEAAVRHRACYWDFFRCNRDRG